MEERRIQPLPTDAGGYLRQLPALALLDRLPTAMLGVGSLGDIAYANPACAAMLGYANAEMVTGLDLPKLLCGHATSAPADCLDTLRTTTSVVDWNHDQGYVIRTMLSEPLLLRHTDALLLIGITDVTSWLWETNRTTAC
jgi:PAS domain-containing protein